MTTITFEQRFIWSNWKKRIDLKQNYYIYVSSTTNNTIISVVDNKGETLAWKSCGMNFEGKEKSTEVASVELGLEVLEVITILGLKNLFFLFKGSSSWHNEILEIFLLKKEFKIVEIKDITGVPFNGCRKWKYRVKKRKRRLSNKNKDK